MNVNNIDPDDLELGNIYIHGEPMYDQNIQPIVAGYIGNYVDPITPKSYFVFMTRDRQIIHIPTATASFSPQY